MRWLYGVMLREVIRAYCFGGPSAFLFRYLFNGALDLGDVHGLVVELDDIAEDRTYLGEFIFVAGYEVEFC